MAPPSPVRLEKQGDGEKLRERGVSMSDDRLVKRGVGGDAPPETAPEGALRSRSGTTGAEIHVSLFYMGDEGGGAVWRAGTTASSGSTVRGQRHLNAAGNAAGEERRDGKLRRAREPRI